MGARMEQRFVGSVVIVTGAGHGIGRAIAQRFGLEGARVIVNDVNPSAADDTARAIIQSGGEALAIPADVSNKEQVDRLVDTTLEQFGDVNVLVNNAGLID